MTSDTGPSAKMPRVDPRYGDAKTLFFVIGAQKSGTTWIGQYMNGHPEICVPLWKEHNYWNMVQGASSPGRMLVAEQEKRDREGAIARRLRRFGLVKNRPRQKAITNALRAAKTPYAPHEGYADAIFELRTPKSKAFGEICPQYALLEPDTFRQMQGLGSNVRFIYIMRDPVARLISGLRHNLRKAHERGGVTAELLKDELTQVLGGKREVAVSKSRYDDTITRLEAVVPSDHIKYLFYESFFEQKEVDGLCDFLGVANFPAELERRVLEGAGGDIKVSVKDRRALALKLAPVYRAMRGKFGDRLPDAWARSEDLLANGGVAHA